MAMLTMRAKRFLKRTRRNLGTKNLLEEPSQQRYLLQMLWCLSVMQLVAMIRVFKMTKNLLIVHLWHTPHQAHQVLQDQIISHESNNKVPKNPENVRYKTCEGYHVVPPLYTGTFLPSKPDLVFTDDPNASESVANVFIIESSTNKPSKDMSKTYRPDAPIVEDWISDSEDETEIESRLVSLNAARPVSTVVTPSTVKSTWPVKHVVNKAHSPVRRPINQRTATKNSNFTKKVTTVKVNKVNVVQGKKGNAEKASAYWV
nr:hypothetical protein [Tanacetum cinerariifolium]